MNLKSRVIGIVWYDGCCTAAFRSSLVCLWPTLTKRKPTIALGITKTI